MKELIKSNPREDDRILIAVGSIIIFISLIAIIISYIFLVNNIEERNNKLIQQLNSAQSAYDLNMSKVMMNSTEKDNVIKILKADKKELRVRLITTEKNASALSVKSLELEDRFVHYYDEVQGLIQKMQAIKD